MTQRVQTDTTLGAGVLLLHVQFQYTVRDTDNLGGSLARGTQISLEVHGGYSVRIG